MAINIFPETGDTLDGALWQKLNKALGLGYVISEGLTIDDGADADSVYVQPGKALINGKLIEIESETAVDLGATGAEAYHLFLKDDGTFTTTVGTAEPSGEWVCLGNVYWNGSDILLGSSQTTRDTFDATFTRGMTSGPEPPIVYRHKDTFENLTNTSTAYSDFTFNVRKGEMWFVQAFLLVDRDAGAGTPAVQIKPTVSGTDAEITWGYFGASYDAMGAGYGPGTVATRSINVQDPASHASRKSHPNIMAFVVGGSTDGVFELNLNDNAGGATNIYSGSYLIARRLYG